MDCLEDLQNKFRDFLLIEYPEWKEKLSEIIDDDEEFYNPIIYLEEKNNVLIFEIEEDWCEITIHIPPIYHVHFIKEKGISEKEWMEMVANYAKELLEGKKIPVEFFKIINVLEVINGDMLSSEDFDERVDLVIRLSGKDYLLEWMGGTDVPPEEIDEKEILSLKNEFSEKADSVLVNSFSDEYRFFMLLDKGEKLLLPTPET